MHCWILIDDFLPLISRNLLYFLLRGSFFLQPVSEITFLRKLDLPEGSLAHRGYLLKRTRLMLGGDYLTSGKERSKKKKGKM